MRTLLAACALTVVLGAPTPALAQHAEHQHPAAPSDTAYRALQERGREGMGVEQYSSRHRFVALPDGGRIELQRLVDDTAGVRAIREHLKAIATAFAEGDFTTPRFVHATDSVPGVAIMAARSDRISYTFQDLPRGGEVRILTTDPEALEAVHQFLAYQRREHRTD